MELLEGIQTSKDISKVEDGIVHQPTSKKTYINLFMIFFLISCLVIAIPLIISSYPVTGQQCHIAKCNDTYFGLVMTLVSPMMNETICTSDGCPKSNFITCYDYNNHLSIKQPYIFNYIIVSLFFFGFASAIAIYLVSRCFTLSYETKIFGSAILFVLFSVALIICFAYGRQSSSTSCLVQSCQQEIYGSIFDLYSPNGDTLYHDQVCTTQKCPEKEISVNCYLKNDRLYLNRIYDMEPMMFGFYFAGLASFTMLYMIIYMVTS